MFLEGVGEGFLEDADSFGDLLDVGGDGGLGELVDFSLEGEEGDELGVLFVGVHEGGGLADALGLADEGRKLALGVGADKGGGGEAYAALWVHGGRGSGDKNGNYFKGRERGNEWRC